MHTLTTCLCYANVVMLAVRIGRQTEYTAHGFVHLIGGCGWILKTDF